MKFWTIALLAGVGGMLVVGPAFAADEQRTRERGSRSFRQRERSTAETVRSSSRESSARSFSRERSTSREPSASSFSRGDDDRGSRAWRSSDTSREIHRQLAPGGESRDRYTGSRQDDGRDFQALRHDRQALTGTRDNVRVWTPRTEREPIDLSVNTESTRRDRTRRSVDRDPQTRPLRLTQNEHGPISPSEWQAHRQSRIDARRGDTPDRGDDRGGDRHDFRRGDDNWDFRNEDRGDRNVPESYRWKDKSPLGPTEFGRDYIRQYDTRTHRHHDGCGHYRYDDDWHDFPKEHQHHSGCGHHYYDNDWHRWSRDHRHHAGCGHHYDDGAWYDFPRGHRHEKHCGHHYYDGLWHWYPKSHTHGPNCGHYYYDSDWYYWPRTHRHHAGCGHYYFNFLWYPYAPTYYGYTETISVYGGGSSSYTTRIVGPTSGSARDHAERAYERSRNGDAYGAIAAFSTAIATTPDNGPLYLAQGLTYMQVGDYRTAYSKIVEGLRRTPDIAEGHPDLKSLIPDPETIEWHADELTWAIEDNPGNDRAVFVLGYLRFLMGEYEDAKVALQAAAGLNGENEQARRLLEFIYQIEAGQAA